VSAELVAQWLAQCTEPVFAEHLNCPLPLLKTKRALARVKPGQRVYVRATDPSSMRDLTAYAAESGHRLLLALEADGYFHFVFEKVEI